MEQTITVRPDFEQLRVARSESRPLDRLIAHYEVESRLARQLAGSTRDQRSRLYSDVYRDLFESVPDHPQHRADRNVRVDRIKVQLAALSRELTTASTYVEIGCGDAALTKSIAPFVRAAIGVDVTSVLIGNDAPASFRFLQSDGITLNLPANSADLVYSNQLMEHLHEDDAAAQLNEIYRVLKVGGRYICVTPNRLTGPHDISAYFSYEPAGFHMREYDHRSLAKMFRAAGFSSGTASVSIKGFRIRVPPAAMGAAEWLIEKLPRGLRQTLMLRSAVANVLGVTLVGTK